MWLPSSSIRYPIPGRTSLRRNLIVSDDFPTRKCPNFLEGGDKIETKTTHDKMEVDINDPFDQSVTTTKGEIFCYEFIKEDTHIWQPQQEEEDYYEDYLMDQFKTADPLPNLQFTSPTFSATNGSFLNEIMAPMMANSSKPKKTICTHDIVEILKERFVLPKIW